jgi:hypothetical protein
MQAACIMKHDTLAANPQPNGWMTFPPAVAAPVEVFYVVQSTGVLGERNHRVRSDLYETRPQADMELARLRRTDSGSYGVWKSATYIEPAEWLHRVVRSDGTLILPRLHGLEKLADAWSSASLPISMRRHWSSHHAAGLAAPWTTMSRTHTLAIDDEAEVPLIELSDVQGRTWIE